MSIQATVDITRDEAIKKALDVYVEKNRRQLSARFMTMEDSELEDYIEELFYNYNIVR